VRSPAGDKDNDRDDEPRQGRATTTDDKDGDDDVLALPCRQRASGKAATS
jgi:hypothetical protein